MAADIQIFEKFLGFTFLETIMCCRKCGKAFGFNGMIQRLGQGFRSFPGSIKAWKSIYPYKTGDPYVPTSLRKVCVTMDHSGSAEVSQLGRNTGMANLGLKYFLTEVNCILDTLKAILLPKRFSVNLLVGQEEKILQSILTLCCSQLTIHFNVKFQQCTHGHLIILPETGFTTGFSS